MDNDQWRNGPELPRTQIRNSHSFVGGAELLMFVDAMSYQVYVFSKEEEWNEIHGLAGTDDDKMIRAGVVLVPEEKFTTCG